MSKRVYALWTIFLGLVPLFVWAQPVANFSSNVTTACSPIVAQFTDLSTGTPTSWQWNLGNGVTSNLQHPSTTYINPGTYTVTLTVTNAGGNDTKTVINYITVKASPDVYFIGDSSAACPPKNVSFTNQTVPNAGGITTYLWDFGDGGSSTATNPTHFYTTSGNFTVTLVATNSLGCSKTFTKTAYIPISPTPSVSFSSANNNSCVVPATVNFTNTTINATSYEWAFGDGGTSTATNPSHQYNNPGSYTVRLIATNSFGCKDTFTQNAFVNLGALTASFSANPGACVNEPMTFTNTSTPIAGAVFTWYFGDDSVSNIVSPTHTYLTTGTFNVMLVAELGNCKDTAYQSVTITTKPTPQFTASNTVSCTVPFDVQFNNTSTGGATTYLWIFGDGTTSTQSSPLKTYTTSGIYTVKLVASNAVGCSDTITKTNFVYAQQPDSTLFTLNPATYSSHCAPATVSFYAGNTISATPTNYAWNFDNGQTSSCPACGPFNQVTYNVPGVYYVTATSSFGAGCSITKTTTIYIGTTPSISFAVTPDTVCPNQLVNFSNATTGATSYYWQFGDGDTSTLMSPGHMYGVSGNFSVTLIAKNNFCADTVTIPNMVFVHLPTAHFGAAYSCNNRKQFTFTDSSLGANTYFWDFGDGNTSTSSGPTLTHTYTNFGTYTVTQIVTNTASGCTDIFRRIIRSAPFNIDFSGGPANLCRNQTAGFAPVVDSNDTSYTWSFGDGGTSQAQTPSYQYNTVGNYDVKMVVTDIQGCKDSLTKTNYIHVGGPVANFSGTPVLGCAPLNVNLTDISATVGAPVNQRVWTFGDGQQTTTGTAGISHLYTTAGSYDVKLKVTDANGCIDSITQNNYINTSKPTVGFFANDTSICIGVATTFTNLSGGNGLTVLWDFGDGSTSATYTPAHAYAASGMYTVKLVITDVNGCKDSLTRSNYIEVTAPAVSFTASDTVEPCPPLAVNFTNNSVGLTSVSWNLGNGGISNLSNPSAVYTYPGVYKVTMIGQNAAGCTDSAFQNITVYGPTGSFIYSTIAGCNPLTVNFSSVSNNTQSYIWDMNNGVTQSTMGTSFSYTYTQSGKYLPKLILSDGMSCLVPIQGADTIKVDEVSADFTLFPASLCDTGTVQFTDTVFISQTAVTRSWLFGDGGSGTAHNPSHFYNAAGTYQVRLIIDNASGCKDTIFKTVTVHTSPNVTAGNSQSICAGQSAPVSLLATGASSYTWIPATGLSCTNCSNPAANPASTTLYTVTGTDANGCTDTGNVTITVNPVPTVSAGPDVTICASASTVLNATGANTYVWTPATGLSCTNCASPTANPASTTSYIVTGTDANGCTDTGNVTVTVSSSPAISGGPNKVICAGLSTTLQGTGGISYTWSPAAGLSCTNCASPTANPTTTTVYTVTGFAAGGCSNSANVTVTVNALPTISGGPNKVICAGSNTTLQATGGTTYTWTPATGLSCTNCASPTANPTTTTVYTVAGTDGNSCMNTANVTVTVNALPTISGGPDKAICAGSNTTLQGTGGTTYAWSPATGLSCTNCVSPTANPATTTVYTVTGTDGNSCMNTANVTVTVNALPTISSGPNKVICAGSNTTLQATGGTTYTWSPATGLSCTNCSSPTANPVATTVYTVTGTDGNGCANTANVTVTVNALPAISGGGNQSICTGASVQLQGAGGVSYVWTPATGLSCTGCPNPIANPATTTNYTVTGTDANGCVNSATLTVTVNPIPNVTATTTKKILCDGTSAQLQANGATNYTWTPAIALSCVNCANPVATPPNNLLYIVTGTTNGCSDTAQVFIKVLPKPNVNAGPDTFICAGGATILKGSGTASLTWSPAATLSCTTCPSPVATPAGTITYTLTATDTNNCSNTDDVIITVHPAPAVDAGRDTTVCNGDAVQLSANGANSYTWSPSTGLSCINCKSPLASPATQITYTVMGVDGFGCSNTDEVQVSVIQKGPTAAGPDAEVCLGESAQLNASGGDSYTWIPGSGLSDAKIPNPVATPENTIIYSVIIKQGMCFADTSKVKVTVNDIPIVDAGPDQNTVSGTPVQLRALGSNVVKYEWTPSASLDCNDCGSPTATPFITTTYEVVVYTAAGCSAKDEVTITVSCDNSQVFMANTFTPNGDGVNDRFFPQGKGITQIQRLRIFNRWGQIVFDMQNMPLNDESRGWDGTFRNEPLNPDVFVYILNAACESGEPLELKGDISLVR